MLIDDSSGRKVAELQGVTPYSSLCVVLLAVQQKNISKKEAVHTLTLLLEAGLYIGPEIVERFHTILDKL